MNSDGCEQGGVTTQRGEGLGNPSSTAHFSMGKTAGSVPITEKEVNKRQDGRKQAVSVTL